MEASVRILNSTNLTRHFSHSPIPPKYSPLKHPLLTNYNLLPTNRLYYNRTSSSLSQSSSPPPSTPNPLGFLISASQIFKSHLPDPSSRAFVYSKSKESYFAWNWVSKGVREGDLGFLQDRGGDVTVVLLGWLGAERKHLKRYVELYTSRGIHAVTFVIPVKEVLGFDLGRKVEKQVCALVNELVSWLLKGDARERRLLFHTFSNTGWLAYGAILDILQCRGNFMDKIKGCVVDSGGDPNIDPQVWAAGFSAALLKKRSSSTLPSSEATEGPELQTNNSVPKVQENDPLLVETVLLSILEKFFYFILKFPDINRRLSKIISILSKNQPPCPQLYLYSTADRVIPFGSVELFIEDQKMIRKNVRTYNFGSSPHVDHYRSFPQLYSTKLNEFLEECFTVIGQK